MAGRNQLLQMLKTGMMSPDDLTDADLAELSGAMPQPRNDIAPKPQMNSMRVESGPDAGKVTSLNFTGARGPDMAPPTPSAGRSVSWGDLAAKQPELDITRPGIEIVGVGKGKYGKDGNVYIPDGRGGYTQYILGYDREASENAMRFQQDRRAREAQIAQAQASTDHTRAQTEAMGQPKPRDAPAGYRYKADGSMERVPGGPADEKFNEDERKKAADRANTLDLLNEAEKLLPKATESLVGTGWDAFMGAFGKSTGGAEATAQLKTIQGQLVAKMPRMEGPQSNYDVKLYQEMAGQLADSTIPMERRQAALQTIRKLNQQYAPGGAPSAPANAPGDLAAQATAAWGSYEPNKYDYRVSGGNVQRRAK